MRKFKVMFRVVFFKVLVISVLLAGMVAIPSIAKKSTPRPTPRPLIQMAILLDTSGSMEGLIEQAKSQLWKIVNEMALAKRKGVTPRLQVALYEYGKDSIPASENYLRNLVPLSEDLDLLSEELFKLKTNGGSEYCGTVIQAAVRDLKWTKNNDILKVIFIAGNEPFTQGRVDYKKSCKESITNGIVVNTIFCGSNHEGVRTNWKDGADLADGKYMNIDHNKKIVHIDAPQDKRIVELGMKLNKTYVAYGKRGLKSKKRQEAQDSNAASLSNTVNVQRQVAKASKNYSNAKWDLVDAEKEGKVSVDKIAEEDLPEVMKKMTKKERVAYVAKMKKEREKLQKEISKLRKSRDKFVAEKRKKMAGSETLDDAIINAVRSQAKKKKYKFEKK
ncbi:MAG: VWA domain-containing protein [bacterium]|nr:VWA domain-containing protein [bacterium]